MTAAAAAFDDADRNALGARGISEDEARRQLETLRRPPRHVRLERPCSPGDGILRLNDGDHAELLARHAEACAAGRFTKFVPASGAATRMFRELLYYQSGPGRGSDWDAVKRAADGGDARAGVLVRFFGGIDRFAFLDEIRDTLAERGEDARRCLARPEVSKVLDALLDSAGMDYDRLPKGMLTFHREGGAARTAFEEHLAEGAEYARAADGRCRLHFTVSPEHREGFEALLRRVRAEREAALDAVFDVS